MRGSCQLLAKVLHEVLVNRLGGLSLPRKSVARLTDRPDMTLDVYRGRKTQQHLVVVLPSLTKSQHQMLFEYLASSAC